MRPLYISDLSIEPIFTYLNSIAKHYFTTSEFEVHKTLLLGID